ncbi:MAG: efflux RND transporter periplasmic adaptor subunit [Rariglobus sp.]
MQTRVSSGQELTKKGPADLPAGPIDLLGIEKELTRLAEDRDAKGQGTRRILGFILNLTNGLGISYAEIGEKQLNWRELIWKEADNGFHQSLLEALGGPVKQALIKNVVVVAPMELFAHHFSITVPLVHEGKARGVVSLILVAPTMDDIQPFVAVLQASLGFLHYNFLHAEAKNSRQAVEQTAALVELSSLASAAPFFEEGVRIIAERIQKHLGCHLVALGVVKRKRVKLEHVSGADHFDAWGSATASIESAMRDAVIAGEPVQWPRKADAGRLGVDLSDVAQQELHHTLGLERVCSVPLAQADGKIVAVMTLMWRGENAPSAEGERFIRAAAPHLGSLLGVLRRADPANARKWWFHLWGRLTRVRRGVLIGVALAVIAILAMPIPFPVKVDCVVEPALRRVVSAQFDGILKESRVKPGDLVKKDDLLASMDDKQLLWRKAELVASRDRAIRQRDLAMADPRAAVATAQMAQLEADGIELELRLIAFKQENLELRSPIDGMVLVGDLERAQGIPVGQGDVLFEVGPVNQMVTELMIPAYDISLVKPGDTLSMRLSSFPGKNWTATIAKIRPQAETVDGQSVFVAEAVLSADESLELRAGMRGRASIRGESAPIAWVLTRRVWGFIQTTLFW